MLIAISLLSGLLCIPWPSTLSGSNTYTSPTTAIASFSTLMYLWACKTFNNASLSASSVLFFIIAASNSTGVILDAIFCIIKEETSSAAFTLSAFALSQIMPGQYWEPWEKSFRRPSFAVLKANNHSLRTYTADLLLTHSSSSSNNLKVPASLNSSSFFFMKTGELFSFLSEMPLSIKLSFTSSLLLKIKIGTDVSDNNFLTNDVLALLLLIITLSATFNVTTCPSIILSVLYSCQSSRIKLTPLRLHTVA